MSTHRPPRLLQVAVLFVNRMLSAKKVAASLNAARGPSFAWLPSRTSRSTTTFFADAIKQVLHTGPRDREQAGAGGDARECDAGGGDGHVGADSKNPSSPITLPDRPRRARRPG